MHQRNVLAIGMGLLVSVLMADAASAYYSPRLGRFLNRDPISEPGAVLVRQAARPATAFIPRDPIVAQPANRFVPRDPVTVQPLNHFVPRDRIYAQARIDQTDVTLYVDGMNLYEYVRNNPLTYVDPLGLCAKTLSFKGHGMSTQCDIAKKSLAKGTCIPEFMTNGIPDGSPILTADDVKAACDGLCCNATLYLYGCGIGKNEAEMKKLAGGCSKIKKVCGYEKLIKYIPWIEITLTAPWNWNCLDVNK